MRDSQTCEPNVQRPINSSLSIGALKKHLLSSADFLFQVGAVIWHPQTKRFLLFIKRKGPYNLPAEFVDGGGWSSLTDPLGFVTRETGHKIERLPLRKYARHYAEPRSDRFDRVRLRPVVAEDQTVDPFKVTVGRLLDTDQQPPWGTPRQVVTFWFAGVIVDEDPPLAAPAKTTPSTLRVGHLVGMSRAMNDFGDRGFEGFQERAVLQTFVDLWNRTYPDKAV